MSQVTVRQYRAADQDNVVGLWKACRLTRPWNDPVRDMERKCEVAPELFLVAERDGELVGTAMGGYDGHRGWVYYLAVARPERGKGVGRTLIEHLERALRKRGCAKLNLQVRSDNQQAIAFYEHLGFHRDAVISLGKRLIPDD